MRRQNRIFYIGMITTESYGAAVGENVFSGAGERKMTSVTRAMRCAGLRAVVLSIPFVGMKAKRSIYWQPVVINDEGAPAVFLPTAKSTYLRKILGPVILTAFAIQSIRPGDRVIFYNHAIEFLLVLVWLKFTGIKMYLDIEDAPGGDESGLRGILSRFSFAIMFGATENRKMVVADNVARALDLDDYVVVRGVSSQSGYVASDVQTHKWQALHNGGPLLLHFGGTLLRDTGVDLFCEAVEALARHDKGLAREVVFKVTGVGELQKIRALQSKIDGNETVRVQLRAGLSRAEYMNEISNCHGGLSLRDPGSHMAKRTFPSKVIEITTAGLGLIATDRGDVESLFNEKSAFLVPAFSPEALVEMIVKIAGNTRQLEHVARAGFDLCSRTFSLQAVGDDLAKLVRD